MLRLRNGLLLVVGFLLGIVLAILTTVVFLSLVPVLFVWNMCQEMAPDGWERTREKWALRGRRV